MRHAGQVTVAGSAVDFLFKLAEEQEVRDLRAEAAEQTGAQPTTGVVIRPLLTLPCLFLLGVLIWVAGVFDLWLHPGWLALTAVSWALSVWYLRVLWRPRTA